MQYGLIGEKLGHSFSKIIHEHLAGYRYELKELPREALAQFLEQRDFAAINVTIPYKQAVMAYLDEIDGAAKAIGAVNTIVNTGGKLKGYNTDYLGLKALIEKGGASLQGKTVAVLGSGGTSLTARQVATDMGAERVVRVSRRATPGCITYEELYSRYRSAQVLINTTPVGMYPQVEGAAVDIEQLEGLEAIFDAVYNPLRTDLVLEAKQRGLIAAGGLYMLVAQAVYASELFTGMTLSPEMFETEYQHILCKMQNIALAGMPGSGKTTVGKLLAEALGRDYIDTDVLIEKQAGKPISDIFAASGEAAFRRVESETVQAIAKQPTGAVIALGGGAVLDPANVRALKRNAKIYYINRKIEDIVPTVDRPLALDREALQQRYRERHAIYEQCADTEIQVTADAAAVAEAIRKDYLSEN